MYVVAKSMHAWAEHEKANLDGTRHVFEATAEAGVKRIVHISTFGIYRWSIFRTINEESPQLNGARRQGGPYRATKQTSEAMAWDLSRKHGLALTTVRPSAVYGARDNNFLRPVYRLMKLPLLPLPSINFPIVYAGDVANGVVGALGNDTSIGQAYNVCGEAQQFSDFVKAVNAVVSKPRPLIAMPIPLTIKVDNSKAARDIGFRNRPFEDALREIVQEENPPSHLRA
jgi:nucleoside-diphosphate-sugar epimerase